MTWYALLFQQKNTKFLPTGNSTAGNSNRPIWVNSGARRSHCCCSRVVRLSLAAVAAAAAFLPFIYFFFVLFVQRKARQLRCYLSFISSCSPNFLFTVTFTCLFLFISSTLLIKNYFMRTEQRGFMAFCSCGEITFLFSNFFLSVISFETKDLLNFRCFCFALMNSGFITKFRKKKKTMRELRILVGKVRKKWKIFHQ